jgi:hypothetical protein
VKSYWLEAPVGRRGLAAPTHRRRRKQARCPRSVEDAPRYNISSHSATLCDLCGFLTFRSLGEGGGGKSSYSIGAAGLLAAPLTAAVKVLFRRYIWARGKLV